MNKPTHYVSRKGDRWPRRRPVKSAPTGRQPCGLIYAGAEDYIVGLEQERRA